mmetsp:Transcript_1268/g.3423  ORF Transcript_1268/g.3423 Transcript_1268/m.3423 type:complete len:434 (+) Transcript_1268:906-2207(+)
MVSITAKRSQVPAEVVCVLVCTSMSAAWSRSQPMVLSKAFWASIMRPVSLPTSTNTGEYFTQSCGDKRGAGGPTGEVLLSLSMASANTASGTLPAELLCTSSSTTPDTFLGELVGTFSSLFSCTCFSFSCSSFASSSSSSCFFSASGFLSVPSFSSFSSSASFSSSSWTARASFFNMSSLSVPGSLPSLPFTFCPTSAVRTSLSVPGLLPSLPFTFRPTSTARTSVLVSVRVLSPSPLPRAMKASPASPSSLAAGAAWPPFPAALPSLVLWLRAPVASSARSGADAAPSAPLLAYTAFPVSLPPPAAGAAGLPSPGGSPCATWPPARTPLPCGGRRRAPVFACNSEAAAAGLVSASRVALGSARSRSGSVGGAMAVLAPLSVVRSERLGRSGGSPWMPESKLPMRGAAPLSMLLAPEASTTAAARCGSLSRLT